MPVIEIVYSEDDDAKLKDEYQNMRVTMQRLGRKSMPPTFEQWLGARAVAGDGTSMSGVELDDMRVFNAIEKLVTSLDPHDLGLAHLGRHGGAPEKSALDLAQVIVTDLSLPPQYLKRIQDLFEHYLKNAKDVADAGNVGVTNRTYGALNEAYRKLLDRTAKAVEHLGQERAIGRAEGAVAILASLEILDRANAEKKTRAFKLQLRNAQKSTWVGKVFGGPSAKDI
jgi:hypothetical protein